LKAPHPDGIEDWTPQELADFLASWQDKCFNEPTGMRDVIASTSKLSQTDLAALAECVQDLPPRGAETARRSTLRRFKGTPYEG
jgi:hypothetical protein